MVWVRRSAPGQIMPAMLFIKIPYSFPEFT
jgi:hypothetical protein